MSRFVWQCRQGAIPSQQDLVAEPGLSPPPQHHTRSSAKAAHCRSYRRFSSCIPLRCASTYHRQSLLPAAALNLPATCATSLHPSSYPDTHTPSLPRRLIHAIHATHQAKRSAAHLADSGLAAKERERERREPHLAAPKGETVDRSATTCDRCSFLLLLYIRFRWLHEGALTEIAASFATAKVIEAWSLELEA
jgi:hypothetical protein